MISYRVKKKKKKKRCLIVMFITFNCATYKSLTFFKRKITYLLDMKLKSCVRYKYYFIFNR